LLENVVKELLSSLLLDKAEYLTRFTKLLNVLSSFEYRNFLYIALKVSPGEYFSATVTTNDDAQWWQSNAKMVSSVAALITKIVNDNVPHQKEHLIHWLTGSSGAGLGDGIAIRRAVLVGLSRDKADIEVVLDKSLQQFGDELYIKHTPTLQQEGIVSL
jgi:telomere length regulation protein